MELPDFLCIGAQKAGTTWLFANLSQHPNVWMPPIKELHFFDHLFVPQNRQWTMWHIRQGASQAARWHLQTAEGNLDFGYLRYLSDAVLENPFTLEWYGRMFDRPAGKGKLKGDITPEYSTIPATGIKYLRDVLGAPKFMYMIRHPVSRALSQLRMNVDRAGSVPKTSEQWREAATHWDILNRGDYAAYIPRWISMVSKEDMLFIPYRRVSQEPEKLMAEIESFLRLQPFSGYRKLRQVVHESKKLNIPGEIVELVDRNMQRQVDFIGEHFGAEFLAQT